MAYWRVADFAAARRRAEECGATLYRGALERGDGDFMCQLVDPFGNLIGIVGPCPPNADAEGEAGQAT